MNQRTFVICVLFLISLSIGLWITEMLVAAGLLGRPDVEHALLQDPETQRWHFEVTVFDPADSKRSVYVQSASFSEREYAKSNLNLLLRSLGQKP